MRLPFLVAAASVAAALVPAVAQADTVPASTTSSFELKSSKGYRLNVTSLSGNRILLLAIKGSESSQRAVTYTAAGTTKTMRLKASFGAVGKLDLEFEPRRTKLYKVAKPCSSKKKFAVTTGMWVGKFSFTGELGYSKVTKRRIKGSVQTAPKRECNYEPPKPSHGIHLSSLLDGGTGSPRNDWIGFTITEINSKMHYQAGIRETRGDVTIERDARGTAPLSAVSHSADLSSASVTLDRAPFVGSGQYAQCEYCEGVGTFTGDLSVALPGMAGRHPIAGPGWIGTLVSF